MVKLQSSIAAAMLIKLKKLNLRHGELDEFYEEMNRISELMLSLQRECCQLSDEIDRILKKCLVCR